MGAQSGWACQLGSDASGLKALRVVRVDRALGRKSSKRVQTGVPNHFKNLQGYNPPKI